MTNESNTKIFIPKSKAGNLYLGLRIFTDLLWVVRLRSYKISTFYFVDAIYQNWKVILK